MVIVALHTDKDSSLVTMCKEITVGFKLLENRSKGKILLKLYNISLNLCLVSILACSYISLYK